MLHPHWLAECHVLNAQVQTRAVQRVQGQRWASRGSRRKTTAAEAPPRERRRGRRCRRSILIRQSIAEIWAERNV